MTLTDLFDNPALADPPAQPHSPTSRAAADAIRPDAATLRGKVYDAVRAAGPDGLTDEEGMAATGIGASTYRPRRIELVQAGLVRDGGATRPTKSRRQAAAWVATIHDIPDTAEVVQ